MSDEERFKPPEGPPEEPLSIPSDPPVSEPHHKVPLGDIHITEPPPLRPKGIPDHLKEPLTPPPSRPKTLVMAEEPQTVQVTNWPTWVLLSVLILLIAFGEWKMRQYANTMNHRLANMAQPANTAQYESSLPAIAQTLKDMYARDTLWQNSFTLPKVTGAAPSVSAQPRSRKAATGHAAGRKVRRCVRGHHIRCI